MKTTGKSGVVHSHEKKGRQNKWATLRASALSAALGVSAASGAVTTTFLAGNGDWFDPANWDNGVPTEADTAVISYGRAAVITGGVAVAKTVTIANAAGNGTLTMNDGTLMVTNMAIGTASGTTGVLNQAGGRIVNGTYDNGSAAWLGTVTGAIGIFNQTGGTNAFPYKGGVAVGNNCAVNLSGGALLMYGTLLWKDGSLISLDGGTLSTTIGNDKFSLGFTSSGTGTIQIIRGKFAVQRTMTTPSTGCNRLRMIGSGGSFGGGWNGVVVTNITVHLELDAGGVQPLVLGTKDKNKSYIGGILEIGRLNKCPAVPKTVLLVDGPAGGNLVGAFGQVRWLDGLSGDVVYDYDAGTITLDNIKTPPSGTTVFVY